MRINNSFCQVRSTNFLKRFIIDYYRNNTYQSNYENFIGRNQAKNESRSSLLTKVKRVKIG